MDIDLGWLGTAVLFVLAAAAVALWVLRWLEPQLKIEPFEGDPKASADSLPAVIAAELNRLREEGAGSSLRLATGPDEQLALPAAVPGATQLNLITQLVQLFPRPRHEFHARLLPGGPQGRGIAVSLHVAGHAPANAVLWEYDFSPRPTHEGALGSRGMRPAGVGPTPAIAAAEEEAPAKASATEKPPTPQEPPVPEKPPKATDPPPTDGNQEPPGEDPDAYIYLGLAATAWLLYQLPAEDAANKQHALLSTDWYSYALFRVGAERTLAGAHMDARWSYVKALDVDPHNRGALLNLALHDALAGCNGPAIERLSGLCARLSGADRLMDRMWYRSRFNLGVALLHHALEKRAGRVWPECRGPGTLDDPDACLKLARSALTELITGCEETLGALTKSRRLEPSGTWTYANLMLFLQTVRATAREVLTDAEQS